MKHKCPHCGAPQKTAVEEVLEKDWTCVFPTIQNLPGGTTATFPLKAKIFDTFKIDEIEYRAVPQMPYGDRKFLWEMV